MEEQTTCREGQGFVTIAIGLTGDDHLAEGSGCEDGEKWSDSGNTLEVNQENLQIDCTWCLRQRR